RSVDRRLNAGEPAHEHRVLAFPHGDQRCSGWRQTDYRGRGACARGRDRPFVCGTTETRMTPQETLAELVRIDSVSARSNADIVAYLERRCSAVNLPTRRFSYRDEHGVEKINLI